jgi:DNA-binding beta-propeller fold protein YncE
VSCVIDTPRVKSSCNGVAVSRDGCTLLVSDFTGGSHAIHEFNIADCSRRRVVGSLGSGPLQFRYPCQVWIAPDDFVFVADYGNKHVQVLTPTLDFHSFVGEGELDYSVGVCVNADVVVVSEVDVHRISVFSRLDGALVRQFGSEGSDNGQLCRPHGLCFVSRERHVAVADWGNARVSVFSVDGEFVRHVGVGALDSPHSVACSAFDELVVADTGNGRVVVFSDVGELLMTFGDNVFTGLAVHGCTILAQNCSGCRSVVWS